MMSLANGLSVLFILSKNQLWALLIFAMVSFISLHLFLPLFLRFLSFYQPWGSSLLPVLVVLGVEIDYLFDFFCFLKYACNAMNLPLSTAFTVSQRFWIVVFSF